MDPKLYNAKAMAELIRHINQNDLPFVIGYAEPVPDAAEPNTMTVKIMASDIGTLPSFARHMLDIHTRAAEPKGPVVPNAGRSN